MVRVLLFYIFLLAIFSFLLIKSFVKSQENEYVAIFRFGKLLGIQPPGLNIIIPFLDKPVKIRVDQIPNWQRLPQDELKARVAEIAEQSVRRNN